jgi:uncharacterized protein (DUF1810 family)
MQADDSRLDRFVRAQDRDIAGFATAIAELEAGAKRTHWIWYVFPQIAGLGASVMSRQFAIRDAAEASAYLQHDVLGPRLLEATHVVARQLARGVRLRTLMGMDIDALKLVSSLRLFRQVAQTCAATSARAAELLAAAADVLQRAEQAGYPPCAFTLQQLTVPHHG